MSTRDMAEKWKKTHIYIVLYFVHPTLASQKSNDTTLDILHWHRTSSQNLVDMHVCICCFRGWVVVGEVEDCIHAAVKGAVVRKGQGSCRGRVNVVVVG